MGQTTNQLEQDRAFLADRLTEIVEGDRGAESRSYSEQLTALAENKDYFASVNDAKQAGAAVLGDGGQPEAVRYAALYFLSVLLRHQERLEELGELFDGLGSLFENHSTYPLIYLTYQDARGFDRQYDADKFIQAARELKDRMPEDAGVQHLYAHMVCAWLEKLQRDGREIEPDQVVDALRAVNAAIDLSPSYAKFHATRARLHVLVKDWETARSDINEAIRLEHHNDVSYVVNVSNYQYVRTQILVEEARDEIRRNEEEAEARLAEQVEELRGASNSTLEVVGFFAGIIGVIAGSISVASSQPFEDAARLIIVMMGSLLIAFTGFSMLLGRREITRRYLAVIVVGVAVIAGALLL